MSRRCSPQWSWHWNRVHRPSNTCSTCSAGSSRRHRRPRSSHRKRWCWRSSRKPMSAAMTGCGREIMQHEAMITALKSLKLFGMAQAVDELAKQGAPAYQSAQTLLASLLKAETAERDVRSVAYQMKVARFPTYRDLAGFDFSQSAVNEALMRQLHRCEFVEQMHNIVLVGGPGSGKTAHRVMRNETVILTGDAPITGITWLSASRRDQ